MTDYSDISRFDAYLENRMTHAEMQAFEAELKSNSGLRAAFEAHQQFLDEFSEGMEYRETRKQLKQIHESLYHPQPSFFLSRQFLVPLSIAACFVLAMLAINPQLFTGGKDGSASDYISYADTMSVESEDGAATEPTSTDTGTDAVTSTPDSTSVPGVDDSSMEESWETYFNALRPEPIRVSMETDAGTALLLSADGYFLTSRAILGGQKFVMLWHPADSIGFNAEVIFKDSSSDMAILHCHPDIAETHLSPVPLVFFQDSIRINQRVTALGYYNSRLKQTTGAVQTGPSNGSIEIEIAHQTGYRGAPVFTRAGELVATLGKNNHKNRVTSAQEVHYILAILDDLEKQNRFSGLEQNQRLTAKPYASLSKRYGPFLYEVHPRY